MSKVLCRESSGRVNRLWYSYRLCVGPSGLSGYMTKLVVTNIGMLQGDVSELSKWYQNVLTRTLTLGAGSFYQRRAAGRFSHIKAYRVMI